MTAVNYNFYLKENDNHGYFREDVNILENFKIIRLKVIFFII